jgi:hypothetical protein
VFPAESFDFCHFLVFPQCVQMSAVHVNFQKPQLVFWKL